MTAATPRLQARALYSGIPMTAAAEPHATPPRIAGRYEILHRLASGGMGSVYLASARGAGGFERLVAAKLLHPHLAHEDEFVSMFLDEARLAARIRHPNVVATIDVLGAPELVIIMELVEGAHLGVLARCARAAGARIPVGIAIRIVLDALEGLAAAHELRDDRGRPLGLVHRDVSPQNILVGTDGISRLTDFGVARAEARLTQTRDGQLKGKLGYMAPEIVTGATPERRADLFSMGVVLWECLAGRRLFAGDSDAEIVTRVSMLPIPPLASIAPELAPLDAVLSVALARDPGGRFESARAMARALEEAAPVVSSARAVGELVMTLAPEAVALMRPRRDGEEVRPDEPTPTSSVPERADEITRPVTTAARSRLLQRSRPPGPRRGASLVALGAVAVSLLVAVVAAIAWRSSMIEPRLDADAIVAPMLADADPVLRSGEPPNAAPGASFVPTIELRLRVAADGTVSEAIVADPRPELRDSELRAIDAARTWRFDPAIRDGQPAEAWIRWAMELGRADSVEGFVRIKGSDTLGGSLLPELARAFRAARPGMRVDVEALGSSTGFVGLFDGSADIAASSRRIRADELLEAERLGIVVHELLIGWDGIAVVVHPASPIERITIEDLRAIYSGAGTDLASIGGAPGAMRPITRPPESGTFSFFSEHVLGGARLRADAITIEHSGEIVRHVGSDPLAIAYVGVSWVTPDVRVVPVVGDDGDAVSPDRDAIEQGRYPLARPLLLYVRDHPSAAVIDLLRFVLSAAGRALIADQGFVAVERAPAALDAMEAGSDDERRAPLRLEHATDAAGLDDAARAALAAWVSALPPGARVAVRGHAGDDEHDPEALSAARARGVADAIESAGVAAARIDTRAVGAAQPIGPLGTEARRRLGPRTDVYEVRAR